MAMTEPRNQRFMERPSAVSVKDNGYVVWLLSILDLEPKPLFVYLVDA
jgi:hypothetical protein